MGSTAFLPGSDFNNSFPLSRFLPPVPFGPGSAFLSRQVPGCEWVLDPFGIAPLLDVELAQSGGKVLVAVNNPISRLLLELASAPPKTGELQASLSELASARKGDERLETHLQSLYQTTCNKCRRTVQAEAYIWERDAKAPSGRIYHCPCGEGGEFAVNEDDLILHSRITATDTLHRSRALERVTTPGDPDRSHAEQALACYQPRAIYALVTTINKLDAILPTLPMELKRALLGLLVVVFDETNSLWSHPPDRPRPKQLTVPTKFLERNLWLCLEQAVHRWENLTPVSLLDWQASSSQPGIASTDNRQGGIYVFDGPARELAPALKVIHPGAVITALPRPNQAYWTLSALWTGWFWGQSVAATFKSVLRRRRYDWNWHTDALQSAFTSIAPNLPLNTPFFAILAEPEPAFMTAAMVAAARAGFDLDGIALRERGDPVQITWRRRAFLQEKTQPEEMEPEGVCEALQTYLGSRGEPTSYLHLHAVSLSHLESVHFLHQTNETTTNLQALIQETLADPRFHQYSDGSNMDSGLWSLATWEPEDTLTDKIEIALVRHLQKYPGISSIDLEYELNSIFRGLLTPSPELVQSILDSYAVENNMTWCIRQEDTPSLRMVEMEAAARHLEEIAPRLRFSVEKDVNGRILHWLDGKQVVYTFQVISSTVTGKIFRTPQKPEVESVLVLPSDRIILLSYKLAQDPSLRKYVEHWKVVTFNQLESLSRQSVLNLDAWQKDLTGNQLVSPEQMKLF